MKSHNATVSSNFLPVRMDDPVSQTHSMSFFVRDGILSVADYNSTRVVVVVVAVVVVVVVVALFRDGIT